MRHEESSTLFSKAGSIVVESAGILIEFVALPHGALQAQARHRACRRRWFEGCPQSALEEIGDRAARGYCRASR
jgi:hypothetical protein